MCSPLEPDIWRLLQAFLFGDSEEDGAPDVGTDAGNIQDRRGVAGVLV